MPGRRTPGPPYQKAERGHPPSLNQAESEWLTFRNWGWMNLRARKLVSIVLQNYLILCEQVTGSGEVEELGHDSRW